MIGFFLLILIGLFFYDFARAHNKSAWGWALSGIICYYFSIFVFFRLLGLALEILDLDSFIAWSMWIFNVIEVASGLTGNWILYRLLKKKWSKESNDDDMNGFLDAGL